MTPLLPGLFIELGNTTTIRIVFKDKIDNEMTNIFMVLVDNSNNDMITNNMFLWN